MWVALDMERVEKLHRVRVEEVVGLSPWIDRVCAGRMEDMKMVGARLMCEFSIKSSVDSAQLNQIGSIWDFEPVVVRNATHYFLVTS